MTRARAQTQCTRHSYPVNQRLPSCTSPERRSAAWFEGTVIDSGEPGWVEQARAEFGGAGADVVLDNVGGLVGEACFAAIAPGGRFSADGTPSGQFAVVDTVEAQRLGVTVRAISDVQLGDGDRRRLTRQALAEAAAGRLRPVIGQTFPLAQAAAPMPPSRTGPYSARPCSCRDSRLSQPETRRGPWTGVCRGQARVRHCTPGSSSKCAPRSVVSTVRLVATAAAISRSCAPRFAPLRWTCASSRPSASAVERS